MKALALVIGIVLFAILTAIVWGNDKGAVVEIGLL
jgi:hypothetical protein